jgi:hypothetical protein
VTSETYFRDVQHVSQCVELRRDEHRAMVVCSILRNLVGRARHVDIGEFLFMRYGWESHKKLILYGPTQTSLRSLIDASTPSERTARRTSCAVTWRLNELRGRWIEKFVFPMSFPRTMSPPSWGSSTPRSNGRRTYIHGTRSLHHCAGV